MKNPPEMSEERFSIVWKNREKVFHTVEKVDYVL